MLAGAILASVILYLVDKNHQWKNFWRVTAGAAVIAVAVVGYVMLDDYRQSQKRAAAIREVTPAQADFVPASDSKPVTLDFSKAQPIYKEPPDTLPADFVNWDKPSKDAKKAATAKKCTPDSDPNDPLCIRGKAH